MFYLINKINVDYVTLNKFSKLYNFYERILLNEFLAFYDLVVEF